MRHLIVLAGLVTSAAATPANARDAALPEWMIGQWCTPPSLTDYECETWTRESSRVLQGMARRDDEIELMRISAEGGRLVFHAEPSDQDAADFYAAGPQPPRSILFENLAHDYPQRIRYWREGDLLMAEISLADGGKPVRWTYHRKKD